MSRPHIPSPRPRLGSAWHRTVAVLAGALVTAGSALAVSPTASAATNGNMVTFGDSVATGSRCRCTPFPTKYAGKVSTRVHHTVRMTNFAFGGATSHHVLAQLEKARTRNAIRQANTALIMIGANDFGPAFRRVLAGQQSSTSAFAPVRAQVQRNVTAAVREIRRLHPGIRVIVAGYWNVERDGEVGRASYGSRGMRKAREATSHCNAALRNAVAATGARYVSTFTPFKGDDGNLDPTPLLARDGDHPNAAGHAVIAKVFYRDSPRG